MVLIPRLVRVIPVAAFVLSAALAVAATTAADELSDLRARFQAREPAVQAQKSAGTLGETYLGYLGEPKAGTPGDALKLMTDENADRKRLYELLAQKEGAAPELVADRAARRNFGRAKSGEYLKYPDGQWRQKP